MQNIALAPKLFNCSKLICTRHCMFACWWLIALISVDIQTNRKIDRLTDRQTD